MEEDELAFIETQYAKETKAYMFAMNRLLIFTVCIPFVVGLIYYIKFERSEMMTNAFLSSLCITVILFTIISVSTYMRNLHNVKKDINEKTKTIESTLITEKKYMSLNHTYHFYLHDAYKYTIEVSEPDFQKFEVGDEMNIEYSTYSKAYFGYY